MPKRTILLTVLTTAVLAIGSGAVFAQDAAPKLCRAAVYNDSGASPTCANASLEILNATPNFEAENISAEEIRQGKLREFDVVLFPGGTGSGEAKALGDDGWRELRAFLQDGGGYLGTCAGAYMALVNESRSTGSLIDAELQEGEWERGEAVLEIELTPEGKRVVDEFFEKDDYFADADFSGRLNCAYQNGPIVHPAPSDKLAPYTILAYFRTEIAENDAPVGVQVDSPAIAVGEYGAGRVVICSPHPELTPNLNGFVPALVRYAAGR